MTDKRSDKLVWYAASVIGFNLFIAIIFFYTLNLMDQKVDETMRVVSIERYAYKTILYERNSLININDLTLVNEFHIKAEAEMKSIIETLDYIDNNFASNNIHTKSQIARESTLKYKKLYIESIFIIVELREIKLSLEKQGKILINEVADYVQDKFGAHKTNKDFQILQQLNASMRIWVNSTQIRLHQKEYIQTRKESAIHVIKVKFSTMKNDMKLLRGLAHNDFEKLKTRRFMNAAMLYEKSSNRWIQMNTQLNTQLSEMRLLSDNVLQQARSASEEVVFEMDKQNRQMRGVLLLMVFISILTTVVFTIRILKKDVEKDLQEKS
jgi:hypothetical protein